MLLDFIEFADNPIISLFGRVDHLTHLLGAAWGYCSFALPSSGGLWNICVFAGRHRYIETLMAEVEASKSVEVKESVPRE